MSGIAIAGIVFVCVFAGAVLGISLRSVLPEHHMGAETKDVVKLAIALIATMSALVVGLLISTANSAFDTRSNELLQASANIVVLDRTLAHYGPEAKETRAMLRQVTAAALERMWPTGGGQPAGMDPTRSPADELYDKVAELTPHTDAQRAEQAQAASLAMDLARTRMVLFAQQGRSIPMPFLVVLIFWMVIIFGSFGLFAPANGTVVTVFVVCAMSVAGAIFLILELDQPFTGLIQISSTPLREALAHIGP